MPTATTRTPTGTKAETVDALWIKRTERYYNDIADWAGQSDKQRSDMKRAFEDLRKDGSMERAVEVWKDINVQWLMKTTSISKDQKDSLFEKTQMARTAADTRDIARESLAHHINHYRDIFVQIDPDKRMGLGVRTSRFNKYLGIMDSRHSLGIYHDENDMWAYMHGFAHAAWKKIDFGPEVKKTVDNPPPPQSPMDKEYEWDTNKPTNPPTSPPPPQSPVDNPYEPVTDTTGAKKPVYNPPAASEAAEREDTARKPQNPEGPDFYLIPPDKDKPRGPIVDAVMAKDKDEKREPERTASTEGNKTDTMDRELERNIFLPGVLPKKGDSATFYILGVEDKGKDAIFVVRETAHDRSPVMDLNVAKDSQIYEDIMKIYTAGEIRVKITRLDDDGDEMHSPKAYRVEAVARPNTPPPPPNLESQERSVDTSWPPRFDLPLQQKPAEQKDIVHLLEGEALSSEDMALAKGLLELIRQDSRSRSVAFAPRSSLENGLFKAIKLKTDDGNEYMLGRDIYAAGHIAVLNVNQKTFAIELADNMDRSFSVGKPAVLGDIANTAPVKTITVYDSDMPQP